MEKSKIVIYKKQNNLNRIGIYFPEKVLPFVYFCSPHNKRPRDNAGKIILDALKRYGEHDVWMTSIRYQLFATKGLSCCKCGIIGSFFALEKHPPNKRGEINHSPHFNLYGIDLVGDEVLITKDHIIPKSKGGIEQLDNLQVMCYPCNYAKGNES